MGASDDYTGVDEDCLPYSPAQIHVDEKPGSRRAYRFHIQYSCLSDQREPVSNTCNPQPLEMIYMLQYSCDKGNRFERGVAWQ
jgi:hypothetical protein